MTEQRRPVLDYDDAKKSAFVLEMEAAITRRLAAVGPGKAAVDREIREIIRTYLGRTAWDAMVEADRAVDQGKAEQRRRRRGRVARTERRYPADFDHKLAQAGERDDD